MSKMLNVLDEIEGYVKDIADINVKKTTYPSIKEESNFKYISGYKLKAKYNKKASTNTIADGEVYDCDPISVTIESTIEEKFHDTEGGQLFLSKAGDAKDKFNSIRDKTVKSSFEIFNDIKTKLAEVSNDIMDLKVENVDIKEDIALAIEKLDTIIDCLSGVTK